MSTQDRRRILPPANARPLVFSSSSKSTEEQTENVQLEDIQSQVSKTFIKTGLIGNANGSAFLEYDGNIISVSVYGPRPVRGTFTEKTTLDVHLDDNTKEISSLLNKKICGFIENNFTTVINLNKYPKSGISIFVNILNISNLKESGLLILSLISNATTLALIDSGIEIIDIVSSAYDEESNTVISFIKKEEIVGLLSDSNKTFSNSSDFRKIINKLNIDSKVVKSSIIQFLIQSK